MFFCRVNLSVLLVRLNRICCRCSLLVSDQGCNVGLILLYRCSSWLVVIGINSCCIVCISVVRLVGCSCRGVGCRCWLCSILLRICCSICVVLFMVVSICCWFVFRLVLVSCFSMFSRVFIGVWIWWFMVVRKWFLVSVVCLVVWCVLVNVVVCVWVLLMFIQQLFYFMLLLLYGNGCFCDWIQCQFCVDWVWKVMLIGLCMSVVVLMFVIIWLWLLVCMVVSSCRWLICLVFMVMLNSVCMLLVICVRLQWLVVEWCVWQIIVGRFVVILCKCCFSIW